MNCLSGCVREQTTNMSRLQVSIKSCVHVYILCESIRDLYFPLSLTTLPVGRLKPQCQSVQ